MHACVCVCVCVYSSMTWIKKREWKKSFWSKCVNVNILTSCIVNREAYLKDDSRDGMVKMH